MVLGMCQALPLALPHPSHPPQVINALRVLQVDFKVMHRGPPFPDRQKDTQTHTHTHLLSPLMLLWALGGD